MATNFMNYTDKVTIVTGGTKGIGEGCVRLFIRAGSKVVFCGRDEKGGKALEDELNKSHPGHALFVKCDVSKPEEINNLISATVKAYGRIDCLINNAGVHPPHKPIDDFSVEEFQQLLNNNIVSMFAACKAALPHIRKTKGNIINLSSLVGSMAQDKAVTYVATKGAIIAFTKALAIDESANFVRVNCVSPGNVWTPMWKEAVVAAADQKKCFEDGMNAQLMGRMGTVEESAKLCLFLATEATFTTGVDHILSGGAELAYGDKSRVKGHLHHNAADYGLKF